MRIAHVITENKGNEYPQHVLFIDTETRTVRTNDTRSELVLDFGVAAYWRPERDSRGVNARFHVFRTAAEIWGIIEHHCYQGSKLTIVAHNVAFDWKVINGFSQAQRHGWKVRKLITIGTRNIWSFRKEKKAIQVLDNMNFFSSSLAKLGESIGIGKLNMPNEDAPFDERVTYCKRDVEIMLRAWIIWRSFLVENDLGNFGKTLASQAFNSYRHRFMPHKLYVHTNSAALALERAAYHGGRTEAYHIGTLPTARYHYLDVVSMYPSVMREHEYPVKLRGLQRDVPLPSLKRTLASSCVIARVTLRTREPVYPLVKDNRLIFPVGTFQTVLSTEELEYALEHDHIIGCHELAWYDRASIFVRYVDFFHAKRQEYKRSGNSAFAYIAKLMLNTLYGKFGQRQDVWKEVGTYDSKDTAIWTEYDLELAKYRTYRILNGRLEERQGIEEGYNSMVAVAAHVTANARMKLWRLMQAVGRDNVYYCDTDSIFTNDIGYGKAAPYIGAGQLGALECKRTAASLTIRGAKDYRFGDERTLKGIRADAKYLGDNCYSQVRFQGFKGAWREGRLDRQVIDTVEKRLTGKYYKGNVTSNGRVVPFTLAMADGHQRVL